MRRLLITRPSGLVVVPQFMSASAAAVATGVASVSPTKPSGTAAGDLLLMFCWANNTASTWAAPTGWTLAAGNGAIGCQNMWRIADGGVNDQPTVTRATSSTGAAGVVMVRIAQGTFAASNVNTGAAGLSIDLATVAAGAHRSLLVQVVTNVTNSAGTFTPPGTATERVDTTATGTAVEYAVGDEVVDFGPAGIRTWTKTLSQQARGAMFTISPAA